jgi:hypothetical protein
MKHLLIALALFLMAGQCLAAESPTLRCDVGPVTKVFGKTNWLAYSCSDRTSIVFIAAPGSVAAPFYFFLHRWNGTYQAQGEGNGNKQATDAAYVQIKALTVPQVTAIIGETIKAAAKPKAK